MKELVLVPDHFYNCPICGAPCDVTELTNGIHYMNLTFTGPWRSCTVFLCLNPLAGAPLHYYSHIVEKSVPHRIAFQEFSLDLENRQVLFANDFLRQRCFFKGADDAGHPYPFNFLIEPDFPNLSLLAKKVRTYITFS